MIIGNSNDSNLVGGLRGQNNGLASCMQKLQESFDTQHNLDYITDIVTILKHQNLQEGYYDTLLEDYGNFAEDSSDFLREVHEDNYNKLNQLMENARAELLSEAQLSGSLKPIVGLSLPLLKVFWIKNVFKDFISTQVATEPSVKIGIERQYLKDKDGVKHMLPDVFIDKNVDILSLGRQKLTTEEITLPKIGFDLITQTTGGSRDQEDQVSRLFFIDTIKYDNSADTDAEGTDNTVIKVRIKVDAGTGVFKYVIKDSKNKIVDILMGDLDYETGLLNVSSNAGKIHSITVDGSLSNENHMRTISFGWDKEIAQFDIPDGDHFSTGLTEERIKDEKVIYNYDTTAKILGQMNDTVAQIKDNTIKIFLEKSRERIRGTHLFKGTYFDCKPPIQVSNYTNTDWAKQELKETLDKLSLKLTNILQNEKMAISVIGNPADVRLLDNVQWMYGKDAEVGGCDLGYTFGLYNHSRNFLIGSSYKMEEGKLMILLTPLTEEQITYKLFEYQFFISNEYRDPKNSLTPAVMCSARYLVDEVTPIQGEIEIQNNLESSSAIFQVGSDSRP